MRLSLSSACSSARVEEGRPITNGIIMCGKTTTSRNGTIGRVSYSSMSYCRLPTADCRSAECRLPIADRRFADCRLDCRIVIVDLLPIADLPICVDSIFTRQFVDRHSPIINPSIGTRQSPLASALACLLDQRNRLFLAHDDLAGDDALADLLLARQRVHQIEHEVLDDHPQAARADLARQRLLRDRLERVVRELQLHVLVLEQLLVLTRDRVARLREDLHERRLVELVERADDGEAADE